MEILQLNEYFKLHLGDSQKILKLYPDNYFDSVVCDPPYHLTSIVKRFGKPGSAPAQFGKDGAFSRASRGFMGKEWDGGDIAFRPEFWAEVYRVLKPGGHLLAFSGSRTYHRMACGIEDAGFEIRDQIMWLYGCLDEDTKFVTEYGVEHYSKAIVGQRVLCYDVDTNTYSYQPILEVVVYDYEDTAYRITGDNFEQVVSRNHRCIVERGGRETFSFAETLQREENVPVLEDLLSLQEALHCTDKGASYQEQNLQQEVHECGNRSSEQRNYADGIEESSEDKVLRMRERGLEAGCVATQSENTNVQQTLQRGAQEGCLDCGCSHSTEEISGGIGQTAIEHDGRKEPIMEGWGDVHTSPWELSLTENKTRQGTAGFYADGSEGRVYSGVSLESCAGDRSASNQKRSGSSYKSQCGGQPTAESDVVFNESGSQVVRAWRGHKTAMVRVVPFHLKGKVWCLRVPTGAFVAVRGGVAFPTGNSGFPKSHDVSKGIDKAAGAVRDKIRIPASGRIGGANTVGGDIKGDSRPWIERAKERGYHELDSDEPATDAARQWQGWGSALKPAHEPIVVARKPLIGTIAENVLTYGTGALNIDGCRVGTEKRVNPPASTNGNSICFGSAGRIDALPTEAIGRWPANVIHDGSEEVTMPLGEPSRFFKQCNLEDTEWLAQNLNLYNAETAAENLCLQNVAGSIVQSVAVTSALPAGVRVSEWKAPSMSVTVKESRMLGEAVITAMQSIGQKCLQEWRQERLSPLCSHVSVVAQREPTGTMTITASLLKSDGSVASITFNIMPMNLEAGAKVCEPSCGSKFIYCAKASKKDRDEGLDGFEEKVGGGMSGRHDGSLEGKIVMRRNIHPTVKPTDLMRYLCRLVTPPNGVVLDPFMGSGSTGKAAMLEGFRFVGVDMTEEYVGIAEARIQKALNDSNDLLSYRGRKT